MSKVTGTFVSEIREPTELEKVEKYMTEVEYVLNTKDDIGTIHCILQKRNYATDPMWSGKIVWKPKAIIFEDNREIHLYDTQEQHGIERCICLMNEFVKNNFKTEFDKF